MLGALWRLLVSNLLGNLARLLGNGLRALRVGRRARWVELALVEPLAERPAPKRWWRRETPSLAGLARLVDDLSGDERLTGIVVRLDTAGASWAQAQTLRGILAGARGKGKRVVVHLSSPSLREYYVACAGDTILADESGPLLFTGLAAGATFFAGALAKIGAKAEAEYRGAYKSFAETFTREDMSAAHREALDAILDGIEGDLCEAIAAARKIDVARARELARGGPYTARRAAELGLVDGVRYADEVASHLGDPAPRLAHPGAWRAARWLPLRWRPLIFRPRRVLVLSLHGGIVPGEGTDFPRRTLGARAAARALDAARRDRRVAAVVLHVDSRGGSAAASDLIWREVVRLGRDKPVVAYLASVAASGGYYLACGAQKIVAQPGTLTGSIGVVAGKLNLEGLYEKLGLRSVLLTRGDAAAMNHPARGYSEEERRRLAAEVDALYEQFVRKVAEGRQLSVEAAEAVARGRVWTGADARARGLVDELGDAGAAIRLAESLGRRRGETLVVEDARPVPRRRDLLARLLASRAGDAPSLLDPLLELSALAGERALLLAPDIRIELKLKP